MPTEAKAGREDVPLQYLGSDVRRPRPHRGAMRPARAARGRLAGLREHGRLHGGRRLHLQRLPETRHPLRHVTPRLVGVATPLPSVSLFELYLVLTC